MSTLSSDWDRVKETGSAAACARTMTVDVDGGDSIALYEGDSGMLSSCDFFLFFFEHNEDIP